MTDAEITRAIRKEALGKRRYVVVKRKRLKRFLKETAKLRKALIDARQRIQELEAK